MKWKHIIWDWNGTLFDDCWLCVEVMNECLRRRGLAALDAERYGRLFCFPVRDYYLALGFDLDKESFEISGSEFINEYERRRHECALQTGARRVLEGVRKEGFAQSLLSAYRCETLLELLTHFSLRHYFEHVSGLDDHYAFGKLDNGLRLIQQLDYSPDEVLLVGDTPHDAEVAASMGIQCHLIPSGHASLSRLEACQVPLFEDLDTWLSLLKRNSD